MSQTFLGYPIITKTGANIATAGASAHVAIPVTSSGDIPRYIRLSATAACTFRIGNGTQTALVTDCQVQPGDSLIIAVPSGCNDIAAIQVSGPGQLNVAPLENA